jgi:hypothetical protein
MLRHMVRLFALVCFPSFVLFNPATFALAGNAATGSPARAITRTPGVRSETGSTGVQVLYVNQGTTIYTYDVDPQTLTPTKVGTLAVSEMTFFYGLIPGPDDHFIYVVGTDAQLAFHIWVFATNTTGAPQATAVQDMTVSLYGLPVIDSTGNFLYAVLAVPASEPFTEVFSIERYSIDQGTGRLSQGQAEVSYTLSFSDTEYCVLALDSFDTNTMSLYADINCSGSYGAEASIYFEYAVNSQTGALAPGVQLYLWTNDSGGAQNIQFLGGLMFDFVIPNDYQPNADMVNIYPIKPVTNSQNALVHCAETMLEACGSATGIAHPSGKYVFMWTAPELTEIDQVEVQQQKIVDTGNSIPWMMRQFSPDGSLVYGIAAPSYYDVEIYGFNVETGAVTAGTPIYVAAGSYPNIYPAQRF